MNAELQAARQQAYSKKQLLDHLEKIEALSGAKRWRAVKDFLFKINPRIRPIDDQFCAGIRETRNGMLNETGSSKSGDIRNLLDMPVYMYEALILADPELNYNINISHDRELQKATWRKVAEAFPEYRLARTI